jgi:hypothetical protein
MTRAKIVLAVLGFLRPQDHPSPGMFETTFISFTHQFAISLSFLTNLLFFPYSSFFVPCHLILILSVSMNMGLWATGSYDELCLDVFSTLLPSVYHQNLSLFLKSYLTLKAQLNPTLCILLCF